MTNDTATLYNARAANPDRLTFAGSAHSATVHRMGKIAKISITVVSTQAVITGVIALAASLLADTPVALAIIAGGLIGILATGLFCIRVFGGQFEWSPERFLQRFYRAEIQKLLLIAILLFCAIKWIGIGALPLLLGCVATLMANWLVLLIKL